MTVEIEHKDSGEVIKVVDSDTLRWADLHEADLHGADLHEADLHEADLHWANLHGADLHGADLHGADLHGADLRWANLRWANLHEADLHGANLHEADLHGADLHEAGVYVTDFDQWTVLVNRTHVSIGCKRFTHKQAESKIKKIAPAYNVEGWRLENLLSVIRTGIKVVGRMPGTQNNR